VRGDLEGGIVKVQTSKTFGGVGAPKKSGTHKTTRGPPTFGKKKKKKLGWGATGIQDKKKYRSLKTQNCVWPIP